jgi:PPM family protein phosphatase
MKFTIFQDSRIGGRKTNQDRTGYVYSRDALLMVLADGMGGHRDGQIAAQVAVETISTGFQRQANPIINNPPGFLHGAIQGAHASILAYTEKHELLETPRTTVVVALVQEGACWVAHVGDSRAYHVRGGETLHRTEDHSKLALMVRNGVVTPEAASTHPERNRIYNCLGAHVDPQVEVSQRLEMKAKDTILLCSDGLWGPLPPNAVAITLKRQSVLKAAPQLMNLAQKHAGQDSDNLSVVAMTWDEASTDPNATVTTSLPDGSFSTQIDPLEVTGRMSALSESDIESAIAEINRAIAKSRV